MPSKESSSGFEVVSPNSPAIAAFFHPLVMIGTAFADVNKLLTIYTCVLTSGHEVVLM